MGTTDPNSGEDHAPDSGSATIPPDVGDEATPADAPLDEDDPAVVDPLGDEDEEAAPETPAPESKKK